MVGQREKLAPWHARYLCRRWALEHAGEPPREVLLENLRAPLPPPGSDPREHFAARQQVRVLAQVSCAEEPFAQLDPEVRARHGLAPAPAETRRFAWERPATWAERQARRDPLAPLWPLAALGLLGALARWSGEDRRARVAARVAEARAEEQG
ncbi:hypothetical protein [Nannocystis pusilla]|uniref:hypothetical protein n=1 Tax=Nannocystis pusilla TaxID=889268 RepID=UPI003B7C2C3A